MFRTNTNKLFLLIVCIIPSIVLLWVGGWEAHDFLESLLEIVTKLFGLALFIFLPCFLTMILAESVQNKLEPGKKWLVALLYFPVTCMMVVAVYTLLVEIFKPELGSSTSSLIVILPMLYGVPGAGLIYFIMTFMPKGKKKHIS